MAFQSAANYLAGRFKTCLDWQSWRGPIHLRQPGRISFDDMFSVAECYDLWVHMERATLFNWFDCIRWHTFCERAVTLSMISFNRFVRVMYWAGEEKVDLPFSLFPFILWIFCYFLFLFEENGFLPIKRPALYFVRMEILGLGGFLPKVNKENHVEFLDMLGFSVIVLCFHEL